MKQYKFCVFILVHAQNLVFMKPSASISFLETLFLSLFHIRHGKLNFMEINRDEVPSQD